MTNPNPLQQGVKATWQAILAMGVLSIVLGIIIAAWPGPTTLVVGILFGIFLLISGAYQVIAGLIGERSTACSPSSAARSRWSSASPPSATTW